MPGRRNDALIKLAERRMWGEVCATLDRCEAGVDDYDVRTRRHRGQCIRMIPLPHTDPDL